MQKNLTAILFSSAVLLSAVAPAIIVASPALAAADISAIDRRLEVAVNGFAFNEAEALAALNAGGDINHRNPALDNDTMLIQAIRGFKDPAVVKWLLAHGATASLTNAAGKSAADYAQQFNIGRTAEGREVMALLAPAAAPQTRPAAPAGAPPAAPQRAGAPTATAAPRAAAPAPAPAPAAAGLAGAPAPGVYQCMNQQAMISMMAFGLIDGSSYMQSNGKRGRYTYDGATAVLTLDPGPTPARFKRTGPNLFRPINEDGQLGGFTCPLNTAKSPLRPPW